MESLRNSRDFRRVIEGGNKTPLETITIFVLPNQEGKTRVGISVSRRVGRSVRRNKVKRRIKEAVRKNPEFLPQNHDVVIVARRGVERMTYKEIEEDIRGLSEKRKR